MGVAAGTAGSCDWARCPGCLRHRAYSASLPRSQTAWRLSAHSTYARVIFAFTGPLYAPAGTQGRVASLQGGGPRDQGSGRCPVRLATSTRLSAARNPNRPFRVRRRVGVRRQLPGSVAGTVAPAERARRARSYAADQTWSSIASSGSTASKSRRIFRSRSPAAPFQSSRRTSGHQHASPFASACSTRARTVRSPLGRRKCIHDELSTRITISLGAVAPGVPPESRSIPLFRHVPRAPPFVDGD